MTANGRNGKAEREEAQQVFRQFAWNLAGTLSRRRTPPSARRELNRGKSRDRK